VYRGANERGPRHADRMSLSAPKPIFSWCLAIESPVKNHEAVDHRGAAAGLK